MVTSTEVKRLTRVGAGTPMGDLFRRYWLPIAATADLVEEPVKQVTVLGETLVLFRDRKGTLGLIGERCPHRGTALVYGIPEEGGLRCPYHGRLFDGDGRCLEQPNTRHPAQTNGNPRSRVKAYRVEELGGLIFAYLGPSPVPLLPRWEFLVRDGVLRSIGSVVVPCNWLQCMENALDEAHVEWMHGHFGNYTLERNGRADLQYAVPTGRMNEYQRFDYGLLQSTVGTDDPPIPIIFPNSNFVRRWLVRVPVDDTHTLAIMYFLHSVPAGVKTPPQEVVPVFEIPLPGLGEGGRPTWSVMDASGVDDLLMWYARGPLADRSHEELDPEEDAGVIAFRQLIEENFENLQRGEDPIGVIRDPAANVCIRLPGPEEGKEQATGPLRPGWRKYAASPDRFDPVVAEIKQRVAEKSRS